MLLTALTALAVPALVLLAAPRLERERDWVDARGIALQTVIIMVVLLAIAGGVAGVLLTRGSEATNQLEEQNVTVDPALYTNESLCRAAGHSWDAGTTTCS